VDAVYLRKLFPVGFEEIACMRAYVYEPFIRLSEMFNALLPRLNNVFDVSHQE
jgi:hypothetical protein